MADINWTKEQQSAIHTVDRDILLTASAGSGKTSVLAQRCVYLLTRPEQPCAVDELLVLTYTEAAAAEMRHRIARKLNEFLHNHPSHTHLRRQLILLDQAHISTVHAFCLSVLKEFFYRLGLDPNFTILDAEETGLLKLQIARELFEEHYRQINDSESARTFSNFVPLYSSGSDDRSLVNLLIRLHNFLDTLRDHQAWLLGWQQQWQVISAGDIRNLNVVNHQKQSLRRQLHRILNQLEYTRRTIVQFPQLEIYLTHLEEKLVPLFQDLDQVLSEKTFAEALEQFIALPGLPRVPTRPRGLSDEDIAPAKDIFDKIRDTFKRLQARYSASSHEIQKQIAATGPFANLLFRLHDEFVLHYEKLKQQQNVLDFSDLEHKCLQLLQSDQGPSDVALQLRRRFQYILVDEYQDISPLQDAIIQILSRTGPGSELNSPPPTGNLFMVGDVKQSIYGFRQADPEIFLRKYHSFSPFFALPTPSTQNHLPKRIDLNANFRSRRSVIDGVNYVFSRCLTKPFAGIDYSQDAQLTYGARFYDDLDDDNPSNHLNDNPVEIHLLERNIDNNSDTFNATDNDSSGTNMDNIRSLDTARREALMVARRIRAMVGADHPQQQAEFDILDPRTGSKRPVTYRDIVILLRSMKMHAELWTEVFRKMNIPVHAELTRGYFVATEIQDMISLLTLLDNPQQDIPLAAVLRSPLVGLNESQLAQIRLLAPAKSDPENAPKLIPYYHVVVDYARRGTDRKLRQKLKTFLAQLDQWRSQARRGSLAELIWQIYRDTSLLAFVSGLSGGRQRYNNLLHLHDHARQFDRFTCQGLTRFLRFIDKLREEQGDFGPAPVLTEADNVVRIMSVHKSKGLEFPVVIAGNLARKFNQSDLRSKILFDRTESCPVGLRVVDSYSHDNWSTVPYNVVVDHKQDRSLTEEMRILYVAFTRAREKLILFASVDLIKSRRQWTPWIFDSSKPLPEFLLGSASSPMDWLGPALVGHPDLRPFVTEDYLSSLTYPRNSNNNTFALTLYPADTIQKILNQNPLPSTRPGRIKKVSDLINLAPPRDFFPEVRKIIENIQWRYPHHLLTKLPARAGVTSLKRILEVSEDPDFSPDQILTSLSPSKPSDSPCSDLFQHRPRFLSYQPDKRDASQKGTLTHLFLQKIDLKLSLDSMDLQAQLDEMIRNKVFTEQQALAINLDNINSFLSSDLGRLILSHRKTLSREWSFTMAAPVGDIYPKHSLPEPDRREKILVRGIIDCLVETDSGMIIVDYKTDAITESQCPQRAQSYQSQMRWYRLAVETILGKPVTDTFLYFLTPSVAVPGIGF